MISFRVGLDPKQLKLKRARRMQWLHVRKIGGGQKMAKVLYFSATHFLSVQIWQLRGPVEVKLRLGVQKFSLLITCSQSSLFRPLPDHTSLRVEPSCFRLVLPVTRNILWVEERIYSINSNKFWRLMYIWILLLHLVFWLHGDPKVT